ncbi:hypothetical protein RI129_003202 [Pyrocoelia pectoralis]|uniref:Uncharacterized protein n=1 Tax=Pyrocoelia pectoralis TaxID=417401 RepID=A0AAN7VGJ9_9COLE
MISLDHNEISDWYAQQLQMLNDKLKNVSNRNPLSSSEDEEHFPSRPRRRKRKYKRVINCSDSDDDDDEEWLPFKMQAQDVKSTKPSRPAINPSSAVTNNTVATTQHNVPVGYAVVSGTSSAPQPGSSGIKLKIMKYSPLPLATNTTSDNFLVTQPNSRVLQSLLTSNDQTLANLYTDFSKYGINIENSDPPIQYENVMDPVGTTNSLTDMVLEAMVLQKPTESSQNAAEPSQIPIEPPPKPVEPAQKPVQLIQKPVRPTQNPVQPTQNPVQPTQNPVQLTQKPPEASIIQDKINDEIICISDDDNDNIGKSSVDAYNFMNSNEDEMVQQLFRKHLSKKLHKDSQTFHPTDALIHRTKTNLIALPNMIGELKRYKIPIDLQFSATNVAHFENNVRHGLNPTMDKWLREECMDISHLPIITPTVPNKNIGLPNVIKNKAIPSTLWQQTFVERLNNTMNNKQSLNPSMPTTVKSATIPITTLPANVTYQTTSNVIQSSAAISTCDKNVIPVTVSNMKHESTQKTKPVVLNGANSLSLRSLLFPRQNTIDKPQESTSPAGTNIFVNSPLLHNYLQATKTVTPTSCVAVLSSSNEQLPKKSDDMSPIVIDDTEDTVTKSDVPSKIRVKSLAELLQKV